MIRSGPGHLLSAEAQYQVFSIRLPYQLGSGLPRLQIGVNTEISIQLRSSLEAPGAGLPRHQQQAHRGLAAKQHLNGADHAVGRRVLCFRRLKSHACLRTTAKPKSSSPTRLATTATKCCERKTCRSFARTSLGRPPRQAAERPCPMLLGLHDVQHH